MGIIDPSAIPEVSEKLPTIRNSSDVLGYGINSGIFGVTAGRTCTLALTRISSG